MEKEFYGLVVLYDADYKKQTITEIGRTQDLPYYEALDFYAETPNPPSQIIKWSNPEERIEAILQLEKDIHDPKWLKELFEQI